MSTSKEQLSLALFFEDELPPEPSIEAGSLSISREIAKTMSDAIRDCGMNREEITVRMTELLGAEVSVHMLNAYSSPEREAHKVSFERAIAFDLATGSDWLLQFFARKCGGRAFLGRDAMLAELGRAEMLRDELNGQIKKIKCRMEQAGGRR